MKSEMKWGCGFLGVGGALSALVIAINLALLAAAVWVVVKVLQYTGVI